MKNNVSNLPAKCLAKPEAERFNLNKYLAKYPLSPEILRDLVSLALYLQQMPSAVPSETFRRNSYKQLMQELKSNREASPIKKAE